MLKQKKNGILMNDIIDDIFKFLYSKCYKQGIFARNLDKLLPEWSIYLFIILLVVGFIYYALQSK